MRPLTTAQSKVYAAPGYAVHLRVSVSNDNGGSYQSLNALRERDWVLGATWGETADELVSECRLVLVRQQQDWSLAPLVQSSGLNRAAGSYSPLLAEGVTWVKVETAAAPLDTPPHAGSALWVVAFFGVVRAVAVSEETLEVTVRDFGQRVLDSFIEEETQYGDNTVGVPLQEVVQDILDDHGPPSLILTTQGDPDWVLGRYLQRKEPVAVALDTLAMQIGWKVKYRWVGTAGSEAHALVLRSPERDSTTPDFTLEQYQVRAVPSFALDMEDVRNVVSVVYSDINDLDTAGVPKRKTYEAEDTDSITRYGGSPNGRRWMQLAEGASSNINTAVEAQRLAEAALSDLALPEVDAEVETDYRHYVQLSDYVRLTPNGVHHSENLDLAVIRYQHTVTNGQGANTVLTLRGKPMASKKYWLKAQAMPSVAAMSKFTGPNAPTNLVAQETMNGLRVTFDPPIGGAKPEEYELHVSTSSGFTPSESTRRVVGKLREMVLTDLPAGTTHYFKLVPRDSSGNRGTASSEVEVTPRYVEPRFLQPNITYASLPLNGSFEAWNDTTRLPDAWTPVVGTVGTDILISSLSETGIRSLSMPTATLSEVRGQLFTIAGDEQLTMLAFYRAADTAFLDFIGEVGVVWTDSLGIETRETLAQCNGLAGGLGGFQRIFGFATAPINTRYGQFYILKTRAFAEEFLVDSIRLTILTALPVASLTLVNSFTSFGSGTASLKSYRGPDARVHVWGTVARASAPSSGTTIANAGYAPAASIRYCAVTDTGLGVVELQTDGTIQFISGGHTRIDIDFSFLPS